jgi:predicted outer membrane repeat protein
MSPTRLSRPLLSGSLAAAVALACVPAAGASFYFVNHYAADAHDLAIDGVCESTAGSGLCTLRAAAEEAAASPNDDTIFLGTGSIPLPLGALPDHAPPQGALTLVGNGMLGTQISGTPETDEGMITTTGDLEVRGTRIFLFRSDTRSAITVELGGTLVVESVYFSGNRSGTSGASIHGEESSAIAVRNSIFTVGEGLTGEISAFGSSFACDRCLFLGGQGNIGGAVAVGDDFGPIQARIERSTFQGNQSISGGGAIFALLASPSSSLLILNSTVYGNSTLGHGGGIWSSGQNVFIQNSTIAGNTANSELLGGERGGGIAVESGSSVNVANSIV